MDQGRGAGVARATASEGGVGEVTQAKSRLAPEDVEARRARKKARTDALYFGYTNESNPFGDTQLRSEFVWHKNTASQKTKRERRKRQVEVVEEIEKVKERRKEREAERAEFERLKLEQERLEQQDEAAAFFEKEQKFHEQQVYKRTLVRVGEGREQDVDLVTKNIVVLEALKETDGEITGVHSQGSAFLQRYRLADIERRDPKSLIEADDVDAERLSALIKGLKTFAKVERNDEWRQYWQDAMTLASFRADEIGGGVELLSGIHESVRLDVLQQLDNKNPEELNALQADLAAANVGIDIEFDEAVMRAITMRKAQVRLSRTHAKVQALTSDILANRQREQNAVGRSGALSEQIGHDPSKAAEVSDNGPSEKSQKMYAEEARKPMEKDEGVFGASNEVTLQTRAAYTSASQNVRRITGKFRPRKPQYLNKVKSGYDWNKYNRAHYDRDNPPPKTVQGYKFNIFYPDLLDPTQTPSYKLEAADTQDFCIIRFQAGPPYEDIAFKIVNKEWDIGRRTGYKSVFQRGVLMLHFNFKRLKYRR